MDFDARRVSDRLGRNRSVRVHLFCAPEYQDAELDLHRYSGANDEITLRENRAAYERIALLPRMLVDVSERHMGTTALGEPTLQRGSTYSWRADISFGVIHDLAERSPPQLGGAATEGATERIWPTKEWQISSPEEKGVDSRELAKLVDFGTTRSLDSLLVVRHGKIVVEAYYAPYASGIPHAIYSAVKGVISALLAIASKDGLLDSPTHRVLDYFDRRTIANVDDRKKAITVQNLFGHDLGHRMDNARFNLRDGTQPRLGQVRSRWTDVECSRGHLQL
jgi:hypothetical protein